MNDSSLTHNVLRETDALKQLADHDNIIKLLDIYIWDEKGKNYVVFVFEYCDEGDLRSFSTRNK
jgi:serine/threonine protein kinase